MQEYDNTHRFKKAPIIFRYSTFNNNGRKSESFGNLAAALILGKFRLSIPSMFFGIIWGPAVTMLIPILIRKKWGKSSNSRIRKSNNKTIISVYSLQPSLNFWGISLMCQFSIKALIEMNRFLRSKLNHAIVSGETIHSECWKYCSGNSLRKRYTRNNILNLSVQETHPSLQLSRSNVSKTLRPLDLRTAHAMPHFYAPPDTPESS